MHQLTLQPVLKFIAAQGRAAVTPGDLRQLTGQLRQQLAAKKRQGHNCGAEKLYLRILTTTDFFAGRPRLPCADWLTQINELLVRKNYGYQVQTHPARHPENTFYSHKSPPYQSEPSYDLACYHPAAREHRRGHHGVNGQFSIFYMRCEPMGKRILFGNMQIDDKGKRDWARKTPGAGAAS